MQKSDVVVVGGGMVGAAAALSVANLGLKVLLIERSEPYDYSPEQAFDLRVSAISLASEHLLNDLNAWQQIANWRVCPYRRLGVWESELAYAEFNASAINQSHLGHIVENRLIQLSLWQQIQHHKNVELLIDDNQFSITQNDEYVRLKSDKYDIQTKLLLAADGAKSIVRQKVGIGCTGWNYAQSAMLINVTTELEQQDITWQQFRPTGPVAMLPMPSNNASLVWYHDKEKIKQLSQMSNSDLTKEVLNTFPERLGNINVINKASFPLTRQHANQYCKGRVVLLGDAAHTINPLAGQGVNLGFKDVKALQQVIASAISAGENWSSSKTLAQYEQSRRKDNLLMMSGMDALYKTFSNDLPLFKGLRNLGLFAAQRVPVLKDKVLAYACGIN